jgi:hypothetical protein
LRAITGSGSGGEGIRIDPLSPAHSFKLLGGSALTSSFRMREDYRSFEVSGEYPSQFLTVLFMR